MLLDRRPNRPGGRQRRYHQFHPPQAHWYEPRPAPNGPGVDRTKQVRQREHAEDPSRNKQIRPRTVLSITGPHVLPFLRPPLSRDPPRQSFLLSKVITCNQPADPPKTEFTPRAVPETMRPNPTSTSRSQPHPACPRGTSRSWRGSRTPPARPVSRSRERLAQHGALRNGSHSSSLPRLSFLHHPHPVHVPQIEQREAGRQHRPGGEEQQILKR